jgi:hypothetical protein
MNMTIARFRARFHSFFSFSGVQNLGNFFPFQPTGSLHQIRNPFHLYLSGDVHAHDPTVAGWSRSFACIS